MSRRDQWERLWQKGPAVLPSMLLCDFGNLEREVLRLTEAGAAGLHLDVMDGHFVPNMTYGMPIVQALRRLTDLPLDVHLMISNPGSYIESFCEAGADVVSFHIEAEPNPRPLLDRIRRRDAAAGLALNPGTPRERLDPFLDACDLVLVMSVEAGFGGQPFNRAALEKLRSLRSDLNDSQRLEVDGGVNSTTIAACAAAGADLFVVGSAIFEHDDYQAAIGQLTGTAMANERIARNHHVASHPRPAWHHGL